MLKSVFTAVSIVVVVAAGLIVFDPPKKDKFDDNVRIALVGISQELVATTATNSNQDSVRSSEGWLAQER